MAVALTTTGDATSKPTAIQQSRSRGAPGLHVFTSSAESSTAVITASTNESPAVKSTGIGAISEHHATPNKVI